MRATSLLLLTSLSGCSQTSATPTGRLPTPGLVRRAGQPTAPEGSAVRFETTLELCSAAPFPPARLGVSWASVQRGSEAWLRDVRVDLLDAPEGLVVELAPTITLGGASLEPGAPWVDVAELTVSCSRRRFRFPRLFEQSLEGLVQLRASGTFSVDGSPWAPAGHPGD
ncbi:MAG: hypothetical protein MUC96_11830 [Myxococcaceae bacterium]|nr:hypothetical protein [Myxococcaceae bacterium]